MSVRQCWCWCVCAASVWPVQCSGVAASSGSVLAASAGAMVPGHWQPAHGHQPPHSSTAQHWHGLILTQLANEQLLSTEH